MTTILGITGSLRQGSFNSALLRACVSVLPEGVTLDIRTLHDIPLYNGDVESRDGVPASAAALKDAVAAAHGVILATPEYNNGIPGVFKNAIDWMSRPPSDIPRIFHGKVVGLMGASPGPFGTELAQAAWLPVLHTLGTRPWFGKRLRISGADKLFDAQGALQDAKVREQLQQYLHGFVDFVRAQATTT